MIDLKSILQKHPNCLASRTTFKSILLDQYPGEKRMVNILTSIYECGIAERIREKMYVCENDIQTYITQLELDYGTPAKYSKPALQTWISAYKTGCSPEDDSSNNRRQYIFPIYFLIDSGAHMRGDRIGSINAAMEECICSDLADIGKDFDVRIQVITFGTGSRKMFQKPVPLHDVIWNDIHTEGACDFGSAIRKLTDCVENDFDCEAKRLFSGLFIALSGAQSTDKYREAINTFYAKCSPFWRNAVKVGIRIGEDADINALLEFTRSPETIISANEKGLIKRFIRYDDGLSDYDY